MTRFVLHKLILTMLDLLDNNLIMSHDRYLNIKCL